MYDWMVGAAQAVGRTNFAAKDRQTIYDVRESDLWTSEIGQIKEDMLTVPERLGHLSHDDPSAPGSR